MEILNTILFAILTVFVTVQQLWYSRQRLKAKDAIIAAKEAETNALKSTNADLREFAKTYGPSTVKDIISLKEDEAQAAAKKFIREQTEEKDREIKRLIEELQKVKLNQSEITEKNTVEKRSGSGKIKFKGHVTGATISDSKPGGFIAIEDLFAKIQKNDSLWHTFSLMIENPNLEVAHFKGFNDQKEELSYVLRLLFRQDFLSYDFERVDSESFLVKIHSIEPHFREQLASYILSNRYMQIRLEQARKDFSTPLPDEDS